MTDPLTPERLAELELAEADATALAAFRAKYPKEKP